MTGPEHYRRAEELAAEAHRLLGQGDGQATAGAWAAVAQTHAMLALAVDATATWVNVISDTGVVMAGAGAAPPLVTAEPAVLNFASSTELDPSDYTNSEQLLSNVGTAFLTTVPGWAVWVVLVLGLYLVPRISRIIDAAVLGLARRKSAEAPQVNPAMVEAEAATEDAAIRAGLIALNLTKPDDVVVTVLQTARHDPPGPGTLARVRLTRQPGQHS